jgi:pimeloyl-ACP methyl ester carboxylesterase
MAMREETEELVTVPVGRVELVGDLAVPYGAGGLIVFAHGGDGSRRSPRNRFVAEALRRSGLATFLFDLLTEEEEGRQEAGAELELDIPLLAERLDAVTAWLELTSPTRGLPMGYFGASTGAAAALIAAAERPGAVRAIVSCGGRPDLAGEWVPRVQAATLFIVGSGDKAAVRSSEEALRSMFARGQLVLVPGATHLDEPGAFEEVGRLASQWFADHLFASPGLGAHAHGLR